MIVVFALGANGLLVVQETTTKVQRTTTTSLVKPGSTDDPQSSFQILGKQWHNPSDLSSVLMIIGGDIVQVRAYWKLPREHSRDRKTRMLST